MERTGSLMYEFVDVCIGVGGYTHFLRKGLIYHVSATGGVCMYMCVCVCVTGGCILLS